MYRSCIAIWKSGFAWGEAVFLNGKVSSLASKLYCYLEKGLRLSRSGVSI
ncbi:MAG: hypothetical protein P8Q41_16750 [Saprospiraceae bacterium]|nr:hypothetical protein [Saprospiraceae bacterium]